MGDGVNSRTSQGTRSVRLLGPSRGPDDPSEGRNGNLPVRQQVTDSTPGFRNRKDRDLLDTHPGRFLETSLRYSLPFGTVFWVDSSPLTRFHFLFWNAQGRRGVGLKREAEPSVTKESLN